MTADKDGYEPLTVIGSGSFGVIRKCRRKSDGKVFARKEIEYRKMSEKEKKQLVAEVNILRELRHPHIVRYYERFVDKENCLMYIYMEYCEKGDLAQLIKGMRRRKQLMSEDMVWRILGQLTQALHQCHTGGGSKKTSSHPPVLHRDIKPDNVFIDSHNNVKLGDFGLSRVMDESEFARTYVGTPFYMSPELISESRYNVKSDIWALGCLIYELCTLDPPFQAKTQEQLARRIKQGTVPPLPSAYSRELKYIVECMLKTRPESRPSTADLMEHFKIKETVIERVRQAPRTDRILFPSSPTAAVAAASPSRPSIDEQVKSRVVALDARQAALDAREAMLATREAEFSTSFAIREEELRNTLTQKEAELRQQQEALRLSEQMLRKGEEEMRAREEALKRQMADLEVQQKALAEKHAALVNPSAAAMTAIPRRPLSEASNVTNKDSSRVAGILGFYGLNRRKSATQAKQPTTPPLITPPTSAPTSGGWRKAFSRESPPSSTNVTPLRRAVTEREWMKRPTPGEVSDVHDLVENFERFAVGSPIGRKMMTEEEFSIMMHTSP
ncbi:kinase-like domain-containing protein [Gaertneriomyces semiglobifer]|nr:kinase-like domain-containing protein [Gaertneriomyces semiglobifer]